MSMQSEKLPLIITTPHDSDDLHEFAPRAALTPWQIGEMSDKYTFDTGHHEHALGTVRAVSHRALGSLNQPRDYELFRQTDFLENKVWKDGEGLTDEEKEALYQRFYDPFYAEIEKLIDSAKTHRFNRIILWDHHDTGDYDPNSGKRDRKLPGEDRTMPKFILSNFGLPETGEKDPEKPFATAPAPLLMTLQTLLAHEFDFETSEVEINTSYKGGHIIQHHGDPNYPSDIEIWAVQIEYNRGFVMDQATREANWEEIRKLNSKFITVMSQLCESI